MKSHILKKTGFLMALAMVGIFVSCQGDDKVSVKEVSLDVTSLSLFVGEEASLVATITPEKADNLDVSWTSDNTDVVTVDLEGNLVAVAPGAAIVTVTTDDGAFTASCNVEVKNSYTYGGVQTEIKTATYFNYIEGETNEEGGMQFWFYPLEGEEESFDDTDNYIWIDVPVQSFNSDYTLVEECFDWCWWVEIYFDETYYSAFGDFEDDVVSGYIHTETISENTYRIEMYLELADEETLALSFYGEMGEFGYYESDEDRVDNEMRRGNFLR